MAKMVDAVVIGAGINGSWSALHLSRKGYQTLLIEQFPIPHTRGSSHGQSRGIRKAYPEAFLTHMMQDAYDQWYQLERDSGINLLKETGLLVLGARDDPHFDSVVKSFKENPDAKYQLHDPIQLSEQYPNLTMGSETWGCYDPVAGVLMADKALKTVWQTFQNEGGKIMDNCPVKKILADSSDEVRLILSDDRTVVTKYLVICAGAWTNRLLDPIGWKLPLQPIKIPVFYYKADGHIPHTFIYEDEDRASHIWGLPELEYPGLVKICLHTGSNIDPEQRDVVDITSDKEKLREFISTKFPKVEPIPSIEESCIYTLSPDGVHILDKHPRHPNIVVGCGFSGSGFKLGPVTGEFLATLVVGKCPKYAVEPFAASRFPETSLQSFL